MSDSSCGSCNAPGCGEKKPADERLHKNLSRIRHKIVVLSGKGGVGKSTVAVNLAVGLSLAGKRVGLLDVDVHGPSAPRLLSLSGKDPHMEPDGMEPVPWSRNLSVMSLGFLLKDPNQAVIWRGPVKGGLIRQFLEDVAWGELDYLVVDCPPGTGDEPLSVLQFLGPAARAVVVTTPQAVAVDDVRRSVSFVRMCGNPILGIVENMSGFVCRHCGQVENIFAAGGGESLAKEMGAPFLGRIPLDPELVRSADEGYPLLKVDRECPAARAFAAVLEPVLALDAARPGPAAPAAPVLPGNGATRIALPLEGAMLCNHFGHCDQFLLVDVDNASKTVAATTRITPPSQEPGLMPGWLADQGAHVVLARSMSGQARELCAQRGLHVVAGVPSGNPAAVLDAYLSGVLRTGANTSEH